MKKKKFTIICTAVSLVILIAVIVLALIKANKLVGKSDDTSDTSSTASDVVVEIGNIEETESGSDNNSSDNLSFIEPDETEADKLLNENNKSKDNSKAESAKTESTISSSEAEETESVEVQTFEEGKTELEDTADNYLKANKIDPKTAGETGEICPNCGKKIWNPDKYGFFIPGMPDDYENSGYCLGTCGISLE